MQSPLCPVTSLDIRHYLLVRRSSLVQSVATALQRMALLFFSEADLWMRQYSWKGGCDQASHIISYNLHGTDIFPPFRLANFAFTYQVWTQGPHISWAPVLWFSQIVLGAVFIHAGPGYNSPLEDLSYQPLYSSLPFFPQIQFICNIGLVLGMHDHLFTRIPPVSLLPGTQ